MIVSNEPGFYERNKFGIRIENLIYVKKEKTRRYFENLTMVPIDKDLIDESILNEDEKIWINKPLISNGYINTPKEYGLGVKLDWDIISKYQTN